MLERTISLAQRLRDWYSRVHSRTSYRISFGMLSLAILAVCAWFIWQQVSGSYSTVAESGLQLAPERLAISWLCVTAATALGAWEWTLLVRALGGKLDLVQGMSTHLTSNLAKYVPGYIWSYAGKGILAVRQGVPANVATVSIAAEFAIVYICGALLTLIALPFSDLVALPLGWRAVLQVAAIGLAGLAILGIFPLARWPALQAKAKRSKLLEPLLSFRPSRTSFVVLAVLITWWLLAYGFSILYGQSLYSGWNHMARHAVALAGALLLGQIAFFAPTGVGVREAVLVTLLAASSNAAEVLILAIVFRIEMILGEVLCAAIAMAAARAQSVLKSRSGANNTNG